MLTVQDRPHVALSGSLTNALECNALFDEQGNVEARRSADAARLSAHVRRIHFREST